MNLIPAHKLHILLSFLLLTAVFHANAENPKTTTFNSAGHPKAMGIKFTLGYPSTWSAREGKHPHVVQMIVSPDPTESFMIVIPELGPLTKEEEVEILSEENISILVPKDAQMLSYTTTKLDGQLCGMCEWLVRVDRAGITMEQRSLAFILPYQGRVIVLTGTTGGLAGSPKLAQKFTAAKPHFQIIAASLFLPAKWEKR